MAKQTEKYYKALVSFASTNESFEEGKIYKLSTKQAEKHAAHLVEATLDDIAANT